MKEEIKPEKEITEVSDGDLESVAGGYGVVDIEYKTYKNLVNKIYFACNKRNVKPCCPSCGKVLKLLTSNLMSDEELDAAHKRGHVICHSCHCEAGPDDWVFSKYNHR